MKARNITLLHYDAILFDVDGTLIDSAPGIIHTLQEVFCTMGVDVSGVNLRRYLGPPLRKSFGEHFTDPALIEKATDLYRTSYAVKGSHECAVFPGVPQMLQRLKQAGFLLCTATSKPTKVVTPFWRSRGWHSILILSAVPLWTRAGTPRPRSCVMCSASLLCRASGC